METLNSEYIQQENLDKKTKTYLWQTAIGLQKVDNLTTSDYLMEIANKNIEGLTDISEVKSLIESYYKQDRVKNKSDRTEEADKVSVRIAEILGEKGFVFSPAQLIIIHKRLFDGIYLGAGKIRNYNITKKEWVLDGETVHYGVASELNATLDYDFMVEREFDYSNLTTNKIIKHLAFFVSRLWQIHPFCEGNTRTTAVFFIKYLNTLGYDVNNNIFEKNSWYFRNALVRANYSNLKKNINKTSIFLEKFLENLILNKTNILKNRCLHINYKLSNSNDDIHKSEMIKQ